MNPIPTLFDIQNVISVHVHDEPTLKDWLRDEKPKLVETAVTPLFAAIQERDAEIERLKARLQECYSEAESIWHSSDYEADKSFAATIMGASNIAKRNGTTEPEPAKPETFEAYGETCEHCGGSNIQQTGCSRCGAPVCCDDCCKQATQEFAKPDPYAHLREADAQGKVIQVNTNTKDAPYWVDFPVPSYIKSPEYYRVKPWELPPPPEGKQWHRVDGWTEDMLPEGWRPLLLGEMDALDDEEFIDGGWVKVLRAYREPTENFDQHTRTRRPLPEPQTWVDLGPEDCPPGSVLRAIDSTNRGWLNILAVFEDGLRYTGYTETKETHFRAYSQLSTTHQINRSLSTGKWDPNAWEDCKKLKV